MIYVHPNLGFGLGIFGYFDCQLLISDGFGLNYNIRREATSTGLRCPSVRLHIRPSVQYDKSSRSVYRFSRYTCYSYTIFVLSANDGLQELVKLAKKLKKEKVNIDIINIGEEDANTALLNKFIGETFL